MFITLRRRSPKLLAEVAALAPSAWRRVELDIPTRKYQSPRVYEQRVCLIKRTFRQLFIRDLGHEEPTILLTNSTATHKQLITRYAQRMLIENALSDAVRFFHADALSSSVGFKVDYDMALLVVASALYRLMARRMRGYADSQARQIFRDLIDMPADVLKKGPFSLVFSQIVALMFPHRNVFAGRLDELLVAILFPPFVELKLALAQEGESQRTVHGGNTRQRPSPACRRGTSGGSDSLAGASGAPRR